MSNEDLTEVEVLRMRLNAMESSIADLVYNVDQDDKRLKAAGIALAASGLGFLLVVGITTKMSKVISQTAHVHPVEARAVGDTHPNPADSMPNASHMYNEPIDETRTPPAGIAVAEAAQGPESMTSETIRALINSDPIQPKDMIINEGI